MKKLIQKIILIIVLVGWTGCSSDDDKKPVAEEVDPNAELILKLTNNTSKIWYWSASEPGHLSYGQNNADATSNFYANIYQSAAFEYSASANTRCLYENKLTFSLQDGQVKYQLDNNGHTFFNSAFLSVANGSGTSDVCLDYNATGVKSVTIAPSDSFVTQNNVSGQSTGKSLTFSNGGFMGYYIGQSTYEVLSLTPTRMVVRAVMGGDSSKAWYHTFTTTPPVLPDNFETLAWADEFNTPGSTAPDNTKWSYNLGANGGWGNNEAQTYTNSLENAVVEGGVLKITAKKQTLDGSLYTSARLVSENKYEFKYGKIEFRAKLPSGAGTWPALWMLGQNYATSAWPACGEIDIMEHVGNQQNVVHSTLHYPGHSGGNGVSAVTTVPTVSTDFHTYTAIWGATSIKFYVDNVLYHTFANDASTPFNADFFLIMNFAMGGNFGGAINPDFTQATMEVDYVRVYQ